MDKKDLRAFVVNAFFVNPVRFYPARYNRDHALPVIQAAMEDYQKAFGR